MNVEVQDIERIRDLYERGLYLQAYAKSEKYGPLGDWTGTEARIIAGRLASNLGAGRLARRLHLLAFRLDRTSAEARYYYARGVLERRGPLAAWRALRRLGEPDEAAPARLRAEWLGFSALVAGTLRDWDAAERLLARAETLAPDDPWGQVERASLLEMQDRYDEALDAARRALEIHPHPFFRPAVQSCAHLLELMGKDDEAESLLRAASERLESGLIAAQLAVLQTEREQWAEAERSLTLYETLTPLAEKESAQWLAGVRSDVAYHLGDIEAAIRLARASESPFFARIAERLEANPDGKRVLLPVGFVRQHHITCAPATLSALSRHWEMPADHLGVAEQICYDGTPDHSERHWAEQNGYVAREFRVTSEAAVALLDRGVPFTLATVHPGSAHLQAVIGYDARRGTLLLRDPFYRHVGEALAAELLEKHRATGPRGMALVPRARAALLEGIDLPEADLYDRNHRIQRALIEHRREDAQAVYEELEALAPEHRLTLQARRSLAAYDADPTGMLACTEKLLEQFPDDANLQMSRLSCLRELSRRDERLRILEELCAAPARDEKREGEHLFWGQYARELSVDAREHDRAVGLLRRALARAPLDAGNLFTLAGILWDRRRFEEALPLYRFAAGLEDRDEQFAHAYFQAARYLKQGDQALAFLRSRYARFGKQSGQPARTLFRALRERGDLAGAFSLLDEALRLRPDDGELLLFAAGERGRVGRFEQASELLGRAEKRSARTAWLRAAAELAAARLDDREALASWRAVIEAEPLAIDAHRAVAQLLARIEGPAAVRAHFEAVCARFPHHYGLHQLWAEWLRDEDDPGPLLDVLRRLVAINPADAWTRRERAMTLGGRLRDLDAAWPEIREAHRLEPGSPALWGIYGELYTVAGRWDEAKKAFAEAIRLSVDHDWAVAQLVRLCDRGAERRRALRFVYGELVRQTLFGDGLLAFKNVAQGALAPEELLAVLEEARAARPDLWHAWSASIQQLADMERLDEALVRADEAVARFPLHPGLHLDRAGVQAARRDGDAERAALEQALQIRPGWGPAVRRLCAAWERAGRPDEARRLLEEAVRRDPLDAENHQALARMLWEQGEKEAAVERLTIALRREPGYAWPWEALRDWCDALGRPDEAAALARDYTARRPGEARAWLLLARTLGRPEEREERLSALDRATALNPRLFEACDLKAELLGEAGRWDEAFAACRPPVAASTRVPIELKGRAAWLEDRRGDRRAAITRMRAAVSEDKDYHWGWTQLARWYDEGGEVAAYLEAAENMTRIAPQEAYPWGLLGDARLQKGDRAGAKTAWDRAVAISPDYAYAAMSLFDLHFEDDEWDDAARTLDRVAGHVDDPWVAAQGVRLAAKRGDRKGAAEYLRRLCLWPAIPDGDEALLGPLGFCERLLAEAGWDGLAERVYHDLLRHPDLSPEVGEAWVKASARRGEWNCAAVLPDLREHGEVGWSATAGFVEALADAGRVRELHQFLRDNEPVLRARTLTWASSGFALADAGQYAETLRWTRDWEERDGLKPRYLTSRVLALRHAGGASVAGGTENEAEAARIGRHALSLRPDHSTPLHACWLAADAAANGDPSAAADLLQTHAPGGGDGLPPYFGFLHDLVLAVFDVALAEPGSARAAGFARSQKRLGEARRRFPTWRKEKPLSRLHDRAVRRIAAEVGTLAAKTWSLTQTRPV